MGTTDSEAIPIKFVVARAPPTQNFQIPVEKILKHFHLIRIIKLGEIFSLKNYLNFLLKYFHL